MSHLVPVFESFESHTLTILKKDNGEAWFLAKSLASPLGVGRDSKQYVEMGILVSKAGVQKVRSKQCNFIPGVKLRQEQGAA